MDIVAFISLYPLYILIGYILDKPYMKLPNHHHFGVWSWWSYFNTPVKDVPKNVITGNQGWFRIYLHYFFLVFFKLFGRNKHLLKLRLFNTAYNALTALTIHAVAIQAGLPSMQAFLSAVLFLYLISRPQMTSYFVNAEPLAILFTTLALSTLIASANALASDPVQAALWFCAFSFLYGLTTLLNKLNHAVEYGIIFLAYCLITKMFPLWLAAGLSGWLAATGVFVLCFRRYLHKDGAACFFNYLRVASGKGLSLSDLIKHHKVYLGTVLIACGHLVLAAVLGMDLFGLQGKPYQLVSIFLAASLVGLAIQRTFLFHHWIAILPFTALCAGQFLYSIPDLPRPWAWIAGIAMAIPILFRLPKDLKVYFIAEPYALAKFIFGKDAWMFFDPLCPHAIALSRQTPFSEARVMFWSMHVELYVETNRVPVCMEQPFCAASVYLFNPNYDAILADCLPTDRPQYIFDLNAIGIFENYGYFAPLLIYIRTGLRYRPRHLRQGILIYELERVEEPLKPHARFKLLTEVGSQERTLIWENFKELFHVLPGNDGQLIGLRLMVTGTHLYEFMEDAMDRELSSKVSLPAFSTSRPKKNHALRLQLLSWLSPEAVMAVTPPNALPLYLALMAYSLGKNELAKQYEDLIDPEFIRLCAPLSLGFTLGLNFLRMRREASDTLLFPDEQALYFSERPRNLLALMRLLATCMLWNAPEPEQLQRICWILDSIHIEKDHPSPVDTHNRQCLEETRHLLAKQMKAATA